MRCLQKYSPIWCQTRWKEMGCAFRRYESARRDTDLCQLNSSPRMSHLGRNCFSQGDARLRVLPRSISEMHSIEKITQMLSHLTSPQRGCPLSVSFSSLLHWFSETSTHWFTHSLNNYFLSTYSMPGAVLAVGGGVGMK